MPVGLLLLVAGLIVFFVWPAYATLAVILAGIGVGIIVLQILLALIGLAFFSKATKSFDRRWDRF